MAGREKPRGVRGPTELAWDRAESRVQGSIEGVRPEWSNFNFRVKGHSSFSAKQVGGRQEEK